MSKCPFLEQVGLDKLLKRGPNVVPSAMGVVVGDINSRVLDLLPDTGVCVWEISWNHSRVRVLVVYIPIY